MARKKEQAFRTITEVSEWLKTPSHVLRFWESKFTQIKPVKRAGGRRYYRPEDLKVIGGIKYLLHDKGTTIAAVKELFKSNGEKHIKEYSYKHCMFYQGGRYVMMRAKNPEILHAVFGGDAFLSRMEGEWWNRFQGDVFD